MATARGTGIVKKARASKSIAGALMLAGGNIPSNYRTAAAQDVIDSGKMDKIQADTITGKQYRIIIENGIITLEEV